MDLQEQIRTVVVLDSGVGSSDVARALPGGSGIDIAAMIDGLDEARMRLLETTADLVVIFARSQSESVLDLIEYSVRATPARPVVVLGYAVGAGFTKRAFAAGADDLIELPAQPEHVVFALQKAMARKVTGGDVDSGDRAPLICVLGPKGGTGKTLVSTSLAVALAQAGKRVAVVDLDLQFGDVGLTMAVAPEKTIYDLVKAGGSLDTEKLDDFLVTHHSGVKLLLAPSRPDHAAVVTVEILREIFTVMRQMVDFVIVDTPPGFTPEVIATIDAATSVVIVSMLDALSLKNTKLGLETLELMGFPSKHVRLVLNRARSRVGITEGEVVTVVGRVPDVMVPSDRDITRSINEGTPILITKPQSEAAQAFRALARSYVGDSASVAVRMKRQSLFARRKDEDLFADPTPPAKRQSIFARGRETTDAAAEPAGARQRQSIFARGSSATTEPTAPLPVVAANGNGIQPTPGAGALVSDQPNVPEPEIHGEQSMPQAAEQLERESAAAETESAPILQGAATPRPKRQSLITKARGGHSAANVSEPRRKRESLFLHYIGGRGTDTEPPALAAHETAAVPDAGDEGPLSQLQRDETSAPNPDTVAEPEGVAGHENLRDHGAEIEPSGVVPAAADALVARWPGALDSDDRSDQNGHLASSAWPTSEELTTVAGPAATVEPSSPGSLTPSLPVSGWPLADAASQDGSFEVWPAADDGPLPGADAADDPVSAEEPTPVLDRAVPGLRLHDNGYLGAGDDSGDASRPWASAETAPQPARDHGQSDSVSGAGGNVEWWTVLGARADAAAEDSTPQPACEHTGSDDANGSEHDAEQLHAPAHSWER